jgi:hypothetical protein
VRRRGRRHLTGQWINESGGGGEVRIRISGWGSAGEVRGRRCGGDATLTAGGRRGRRMDGT